MVVCRPLIPVLGTQRQGSLVYRARAIQRNPERDRDREERDIERQRTKRERGKKGRREEEV